MRKATAIPESKRLQVLDDLAACDVGEFNIYTLAFTVARLIVEYDDPEFIERIPDRLKEKVFDMAKAYQTDGELVHISNLGETDHSKLAKRLVELIGVGDIKK